MMHAARVRLIERSSLRSLSLLGMASTSSSSQSDADIREKNWVGMLKIGRFAAISMILIGIARYLLLLVLEGNSVLDATTVGSVALGILTLVLTAFAPNPNQLLALGEQRKAKHLGQKLKQN